MRKLFVWVMLLALAARSQAAERKWDFGLMPTNQPPTNCFSITGGDGKPGTWRVIQDQFPLALAPLNPNLPTTAPKNAVAQLSWNAADEHFPMLVLGGESYGDFTFRTHFKMADGLTEQMAGVAFRIQDEQNYYYVRASVLGSTFYFYKVSKGVRSDPIGNQMKFERGVWYELTVKCEGAKIQILLDGKEALPTLTDPTFSSGKIAFWTKSDSISYFTDAKITFKPHEAPAQRMVREVMQEEPKLIGLQVAIVTTNSPESRLIASNNEKEIGQPGEKTDVEAIKSGKNYYRKAKGVVYVTMPLRDRNGDVEAVVRVAMKSFWAETQGNALERALPIVKMMQERAVAVDSLY